MLFAPFQVVFIDPTDSAMLLKTSYDKLHANSFLMPFVEYKISFLVITTSSAKFKGTVTSILR